MRTKSDSVSRLAELMPQLLLAMTHFAKQTPLVDERMTPSQMSFLHLLGVIGGRSKMSDLAKKLGVTQGTLTSTMKKLAARGYLIRRRSLDDDRVVLLTLSKKGREFLDRDKKVHQEVFSKVLARMSRSDQLRFVECHEFILTAMRKAIENEASQ